MSTSNRVYIAGPDIFRPDYADFVDRARGLGRGLGLDLVFPVDLDDRLSRWEQAEFLYMGNVNQILACSAVCANLTPFRGPSVDPGTAVEIGIAIGRGLPVVGYSADSREYSSRLPTNLSSIGLIDNDGCLVEDFGLTDNLMTVCGLLSRIPFGSLEEALRHLVISQNRLSLAARSSTSRDT